MIVPSVRLFPNFRFNKPCNPSTLTLPVMLYYFVEQILNYRLLGNRLCEGKSQAGFLSSLINEVIQVLFFPFRSTKIGIHSFIHCHGFFNLYVPALLVV